MAPSKSKEKKEKAKTSRRKSGSQAKKDTTSTVSEGQSPTEVADQLLKAKSRPQMYDLLKGHAAFNVPEFVKNLPVNVRLPIPIRDNRRVLCGSDEEFFPGQYVRMEGAEYIIVQAPTKKSSKLIWRVILKDHIRILVCLCHDEQMSGSDDGKCYTYFPTELEQKMEAELMKGTLSIVCKAREGLSMGATKYELELTDSEVVIDKNSDDPNASNYKSHRLIVFHMNTWSGQKPTSGNALEQAQNVALFFREVKKFEMDILRKSMENFVPPVMLQSFDGINRASTGWVALMLLRDVEKRECFDVPSLIKAIMKFRNGSISTYYQFCFCMAVCLNIGKDTNWCANDCSTALTDLMEKFGNRKLNELGNLAV